MKTVVVILAFCACGWARDSFADAFAEASGKDGQLNAVIFLMRTGQIAGLPIFPTNDIALSTRGSGTQGSVESCCSREICAVSCFATQKTSAADALEQASGLVRLRQLLYRVGNCDSLLLAETANRAIVAKLSDRTVIECVESTERFSHVLAQARSNVFPIEAWSILISQELRLKGVQKEGCLSTQVVCETAAIDCQTWWAALERQDDIVMPTNVACATLLALTRHRDLSLLLHRYVLSDTYLRLIVSAGTQNQPVMGT